MKIRSAVLVVLNANHAFHNSAYAPKQENLHKFKSFSKSKLRGKNLESLFDSKNTFPSLTGQC